MATYSTSLKTWGSAGSEYPNSYNYLEGEQPVDAWDNFLTHHTITDITHLINLTNARLADEDGTEAASGGVRLQNAEWVASRNSGDTADINVWRVNVSDEIEAGSADVRLGADLLAVNGEVIWDESASHIPAAQIDSTIARDSELYTDEQAQDAVGTILGGGLSYDDATPEITMDVVASGQVTLSGGEATVTTAISAVDATFMVAIGADDPNADTQISSYMLWDDSAGVYDIKFLESETSVGNPTVNYDIVRVR